MRQRVMLGAALVLIGAAAAGCGGGGDEKDTPAKAASTGEYCTLVKDLTDRTKASIAEPDQDYTEDDLKQDGKRLDTIAAAAPTAVAEDWATLVESSRKTQAAFKQALKDNGVGFEEFMKAQRSGELPDGVTAEEMRAIAATTQGPGSEADAAAATAASKAIAAHAKRECDVDMSLGE